MFILRYDISGIGYNGAIYKFVVIFISLNEVEVKVGVSFDDVVSVDNCSYDGFCQPRIDITCNDFLVFFNNFVSDA